MGGDREMHTTSGPPSWVTAPHRIECRFPWLPQARMEYLIHELRHDLLGEDLQLPLDDGQRREALLNPPDQIARIAGLDHLRELPFNIVHRPSIEIVRPLHRVERPGDVAFLPWEPEGFVEAIVAPEGAPAIASDALIRELQGLLPRMADVDLAQTAHVVPRLPDVRSAGLLRSLEVGLRVPARQLGIRDEHDGRNAFPRTPPCCGLTQGEGLEEFRMGLLVGLGDH